MRQQLNARGEIHVRKSSNHEAAGWAMKDWEGVEEARETWEGGGQGEVRRNSFIFF